MATSLGENSIVFPLWEWQISYIKRFLEMSGRRRTSLMCPSWNCTFPDPKRSICVDSSTTIYEILHLDVEGNNSWEWVKWCDAPESSIQLFKYAYKYWADKACHLQNKEGLGTEILCCCMASFKASSFS